jgi:hypothetical protein
MVPIPSSQQRELVHTDNVPKSKKQLSSLFRKPSRFQGQHNNKWSNQIQNQSLAAPHNPPFNIVHIVHTRFMQYQPNLLELGMARLQLFQAFTLPSLFQQRGSDTKTEFLWMIRTDPQLHPTLRAGLLASIENMTQSEQKVHAHVLVLLSNDNPEGFGHDHLPPLHHHHNRSSSPLLYGDYAVWRRYYDEAQLPHSIVIESRLDADDAVHVHFTAAVQSYVKRLALSLDSAGPQQPSVHRVLAEHSHSLHDQKNSHHHHAAALGHKGSKLAANRAKWWVVMCADFHWEWHPYCPWDNVGDSNSTNPMITADKGAILGQYSPMCVTSGLTFVFGPNVSRSDIPVSSAHHKLHKVLPPCEEDHDRLKSVHCLSRVKVGIAGRKDIPLSIRARSISSAGMKQVVLEPGQSITSEQEEQVVNDYWKSQQESMWTVLPEYFGIHPSELKRVRSFLDSHQAGIIADNLLGQCTPGHSCKKGTQLVLQQLLVSKNTSAGTSAKRRRL